MRQRQPRLFCRQWQDQWFLNILCIKRHQCYSRLAISSFARSQTQWVLTICQPDNSKTSKYCITRFNKCHSQSGAEVAITQFILRWRILRSPVSPMALPRPCHSSTTNQLLNLQNNHLWRLKMVNKTSEILVFAVAVSTRTLMPIKIIVKLSVMMVAKAYKNTILKTALMSQMCWLMLKTRVWLGANKVKITITWHLLNLLFQLMEDNLDVVIRNIQMIHRIISFTIKMMKKTTNFSKRKSWLNISFSHLTICITTDHNILTMNKRMLMRPI